MMASDDGFTATSERILRFIEESRQHERERLQQANRTGDHDYEAELDATIARLREQTELQERELIELRRTRTVHLPTPTSTLAERLAQTRCATAAYTSLRGGDGSTGFEPPYLPEAGSVAPDLLALRETANSIQGLQKAIQSCARALSEARQAVSREEADLRDARAIRDGLQERLAGLQASSSSEHQDAAGDGSDQSQRVRLQRLQYEQQTREAELRTKDLRTALDEFVDGTLAAMLAAEELGGPVVGDQPGITDETLALGYTARGAERRPLQQRQRQVQRQQSLDSMLIRDGQGENASASARIAAGERFRELLRQLLDAVPASAYVTLGTADVDSAACRFLVRAKIAQYHPADSRKLRLIDVERPF